MPRIERSRTSVSDYEEIWRYVARDSYDCGFSANVFTPLLDSQVVTYPKTHSVV